MKEYPNILSQINETVWASTEGQLNDIKTVVSGMKTGDIAKLRTEWLKQQELESDSNEPSAQDGEIRRGPGRSIIQGGVAIVPIKGLITGRANMFTAFSGGTSTEVLSSAVRRLTNDPGVHSIIFDVDSNGGSVAGLAEASAVIREAREKKRVYAIANDNMNSAAYWLASAADKVFVTPTAVIGSIGVLSQLVSAARKNKKDGFDVEIIRSTPMKAKPNSLEPIDKEGRSIVQSQVDLFHEMFVQEVSLNRRISLDTAKEMANGEVKIGDEAVKAGIADEVSTLEEVVETANDEEAEAQAELSAQEQVELLTQANDDLAASLTETQTALADAKAELESLKSANAITQTENLIDAAVESGKIAPKKAEAMKAQLAEGTLTPETVEAVVTFASPNSAVPEGDVVEAAVETAEVDEFAPTTEREKEWYKNEPSLKAKYNL